MTRPALRRLLRPGHEKHLGVALCALQTFCAFMALVLLGSAFPRTSLVILPQEGATVVKVGVYYGGPVVSFVLVITYSVFLCGLLRLVLVHWRRSIQPQVELDLAFDALASILMLSSVSALAASDYSIYCHKLQESINCSTMRTAIVFCCLSFVTLLMSLGWTLWSFLESKKAMQDTPASLADAIVEGGATVYMDAGDRYGGLQPPQVPRTAV